MYESPSESRKKIAAALLLRGHPAMPCAYRRCWRWRRAGRLAVELVLEVAKLALPTLNG